MAPRVTHWCIPQEALELTCIITASAYNDTSHHIEHYVIGAAAALLAFKYEWADPGLGKSDVGRMVQALGFGCQHTPTWLGQTVRCAQWWLLEAMNLCLRVPTMLGVAAVSGADVMLRSHGVWDKFNDLVIMSYGKATPSNSMIHLIQQDNRPVILACVYLCTESRETGKDLAEVTARMMGLQEFVWSGSRRVEKITRAIAGILRPGTAESLHGC